MTATTPSDQSRSGRMRRGARIRAASSARVFQVPGVGSFRPRLLSAFDQRLGQQSAGLLGPVRTDHQPLRAAAEATRQRPKPSCGPSTLSPTDCRRLGMPAFSEQALDHLRLDPVPGEGNADQLVAIAVASDRYALMVVSSAGRGPRRGSTAPRKAAPTQSARRAGEVSVAGPPRRRRASSRSSAPLLVLVLDDRVGEQACGLLGAGRSRPTRRAGPAAMNSGASKPRARLRTLGMPASAAAPGSFPLRAGCGRRRP